MKLEWKKNNIGKYARNAAIMTVVLLGLILLVGGQMEAEETIESYGRSMLGSAIEMFTNLSYIVFIGVMLSGFIVSTYENKTIHLMFSYPIKRSKVVLAQIFSVWVFSFVAMVLSKILIYGVMMLTKPYTHVMASGINMGDMSFWLNLLLSSVEMVSISYISLLIGLKMKSSKAAVVTSIIIGCCTQGNIGDYSLNNNIAFYAVLFVLAVISVLLSIHDIERRDV